MITPRQYSPWSRTWVGTDLPEARQAAEELSYQGISPLSSRYFPVGGFSIVASFTAMAAPCSTERGAASLPMSVLTQPGQVELTEILSPARSLAKASVRPLRADFEEL